MKMRKYAFLGRVCKNDIKAFRLALDLIGKEMCDEYGI